MIRHPLAWPVLGLLTLVLVGCGGDGMDTKAPLHEDDIAALQARFDRLDTELTQVGQTVHQSPADAREEFENALHRLSSDRARLRNQIRNLDRVPEEAWVRRHTAIAASLEEFASQVQAVRKDLTAAP
jgi:chromosome segregation ATPase